MLKFEKSKTHYRVMNVKRDKLIMAYVVPLPPAKGAKVDWQAELDRLSEEITKKGYYFNKIWTYPYKTPRDRVIATIGKFGHVLDSLPFADFVPYAEDGWTDAAYKAALKANPKTTRLKLIGKVAAGLFPFFGEIYPLCRRNTRVRPFNLYQCTCGRSVVLPQNIKSKVLYEGCGCRQMTGGARTARQRLLDAVREWCNMYLSCYDTRNKYYDIKNSLDIPSFTVFNKWYDEKARYAGVRQRFIRRVQGKAFKLSELELAEPNGRGETKL